MFLPPLLQQTLREKLESIKRSWRASLNPGKNKTKGVSPLRWNSENGQTLEAGSTGDPFVPFGVEPAKIAPFPLRPFPWPFLPAFSLWLFAVLTIQNPGEGRGIIPDSLGQAAQERAACRTSRHRSPKGETMERTKRKRPDAFQICLQHSRGIGTPRKSLALHGRQRHGQASRNTPELVYNLVYSQRGNIVSLCQIKELWSG
jgi:hypothetical protein